MTESRMTQSQIKKWLVGLLLCPLVTHATQIYQSQNQQGYTVYSDQPSPQARKIKTQLHPYRYRYQLDYVYDGDTIVLKNGDHIRFLGLNTPEIKSHFRDGEPGGLRAKSWLKQKLGKGPVYLEFDQQRHDKYHRLLAYCFTADGEFVNQSLLRQGLAMLSIRPPDLRYTQQLVQAQTKAIRHKLGIWHMHAYQAKTVDRDYPGNDWSGWQRLNVQIKSAEKKRKYRHLIINQWLDITIPNQDVKLFPPLQNYIGKRLQISGWLARHGHHYTMHMEHPSAISRP